MVLLNFTFKLTPQDYIVRTIIHTVHILCSVSDIIGAQLITL